MQPLLMVKVTTVLVVGWYAAFCRAADTDGDNDTGRTCTLTIPDRPFSPESLSGPWTVTGCAQYKPDQATFVEVVVYDPDAGAVVGVYTPLILDPSSTAGAAPTPAPKFPPNAVFGAWIGSNAALVLNGSSTTLAAINCVQGLPTSRFGSFAYCNARAWFAAAATRTVLAPLDAAADGDRCVTTRDFLLADRDPSDNVYSTYLVDAATRSVAQNTAANRARLPNARVAVNGDDTAFVQAMFAALRCPQLVAPSLTEPGQKVPALALDELQGSMLAQAPVALVPDTDPDVTVDGRPSLEKRNLYRQGVNQPTEASGDPSEYCRHYADSARRIARMKAVAVAAPSPDPAMADSLHTFQCRKFVASYDGMKCRDRLGGLENPVTVTSATTGGPVTGCRIETTALSGGGGGSKSMTSGTFLLSSLTPTALAALVAVALLRV